MPAADAVIVVQGNLVTFAGQLRGKYDELITPDSLYSLSVRVKRQRGSEPVYEDDLDIGEVILDPPDLTLDLWNYRLLPDGPNFLWILDGTYTEEHSQRFDTFLTAIDAETGKQMKWRLPPFWTEEE